MRIFKNIEDFIEKNNDLIKWKRAVEAISLKNDIELNTYYNLGDSLVFIRFNKNMTDNRYFKSHIKYMDLHYILEGKNEFLVSNKDNSILIKEYDDIEDSAYYESEKFSTYFLNKGEIVLFEKNDVFKFLNDNQVDKIVIKITIE